MGHCLAFVWLLTPMIWAQDSHTSSRFTTVAVVDPTLDGVTYVPLVPVVVTTESEHSSADLQMERIASAQTVAGGKRIWGALRDSETKEPLVGEKLALYPYCAVASRLRLAEKEDLCHGKPKPSAASNVVTETSTDKSGEFVFQGLPEGDYAVFAIRWGHVTARLHGLPVSDSQNRLLVFVLREGEPRKSVVWIPPNQLPATLR